MATTKQDGRTAKKGQPKPQAVADDLDFDSAASEGEMPATPGRKSKWTELLDKLYTATAEGKVPRGQDGYLKFIRLGTFTNTNGARTQMGALNKRDDGAYAETYEFKCVSKSDGSELWGRVREVEEEEEEGSAEE